MSLSLGADKRRSREKNVMGRTGKMDLHLNPSLKVAPDSDYMHRRNQVIERNQRMCSHAAEHLQLKYEIGLCFI